MKFNKEQRNAIFGKEQLIVVAAGAGSGKTKVLSERYVTICEEKLKSALRFEYGDEFGAEVPQIVTLTFTEDAALEMKDRIRKRLLEKRMSVETEYPHYMEQAKAFWTKQLESLETSSISTFHSFCQKIVMENSFEADIFPDSSVMDETESTLMKTAVFSELVEEGERSQRWETLFKAINKLALKDSIFSVYGKVREYEQKGSLEDALKVDALITSWELEKEEILQEFENDFYQFFYQYEIPPKLTPANQRIWKECLAVFQASLHGKSLLDSLQAEVKPFKTAPKKIAEQFPAFYDVLTHWVTIKEKFQQTEDQEQMVETILHEFGSFLKRFDEDYQLAKKEAGKLDFSDLQQIAQQLLHQPAVQNYYSSLYKHFLIDEAQDTNSLQLRIVERINPSYRFIVGDSKQSVYRFRGADVQLLNRLAIQAEEEEGSAFIDMNINYRTCESIINFINLLFQQEHVMGLERKENDPLYKTIYSPLCAFRNNEFAKQQRVELIKVTEEKEASLEENQYIMLARRMLELKKEKARIFDKELNTERSVEWRDMAVLLASRTNLPLLEMALRRYDIPYNVYGGLGFYQRQEVIDFQNLLCWLNKPYEPYYIMAVLRSPMFAVTMEEFLEIQFHYGEDSNISRFIYENQFRDNTGGKLKQKLENFYQLFEYFVPFSWKGSIYGDLHHLFDVSGLKKVLLLQKNNVMKVGNVEKLIDIIESLHARSMEEMLADLQVLIEISEKEGDADVELTGGDFIHIMTVHASKGLEFPVVCVPHLSRSLTPDRESLRFDLEEGLAVTFKMENEEDLLRDPVSISSANFKQLAERNKDQAVEESKRLFYVALTRARDYLVLSSKDKIQKDTWYEWLCAALERDGNINKVIRISDGVEEQTVETAKSQFYTGPTEKIERSIPISFSVSEVISYMNDPEAFVKKHILNLEDSWIIETETEEILLIDEKEEADLEYKKSAYDARVLGTLVHRICELIDKGYHKNEAYKEAFTSLVQPEEEEIYRKNVAPLVQAFQTNNRGLPIENEWEFIVNINGVHIIGEIDKVVQVDGHYEIMDLKTNQIKANVEELLDYYKPQLYLYKIAYEKEKQISIKNMSFLFLRDKNQGLYTIPFDPLFEKKVLAAIQDMVELKKSYMGRMEKIYG
ncbi:MAG: UvrD-helicase domain-containing protein [Bacillus sp. (in: firmicutes)]